MKKINNLKIVYHLFLVLLVVGAPSSKAASVLFDSTLFRVQNSTGTRYTNSSDFGAAIGYFTGSFVPTTNNYAQWLNNFVGVVGYHKDAGGGFNTVSGAITVIPVDGPANDPDFGVYDYLATVAASQGGPLVAPSTIAGMTLTEGRQFSLILWNAAKATTLGSATEAGIFTNSSWVISNQFDVAAPELTDINLSPSGMTASIGLVNTTVGNRFFQLAVIPEPSTSAFLAFSFAALLAYRRKKNYKEQA
jgi:hypothetical protein